MICHLLHSKNSVLSPLNFSFYVQIIFFLPISTFSLCSIFKSKLLCFTMTQQNQPSPNSHLPQFNSTSLTKYKAFRMIWCVQEAEGMSLDWELQWYRCWILWRVAQWCVVLEWIEGVFNWWWRLYGGVKVKMQNELLIWRKNSSGNFSIE